MHAVLASLLVVFAGGCSSTWTPRDEDGDKVSLLEGDCSEAPGGGADATPGNAETWYDGVDQDCDGKSDYDKDGDGFESAAFGGDDCWDDPDVRPDEFEARNGFAALTAAEVFPGATEVWYDGVDGDCDGASDFDQDGDGYDTSNPDYPGLAGVPGDDCYDSVDTDAYPESGDLVTTFPPEDINPAATEAWYDGTDQDCDGHSDYDQDFDGYNVDSECDDEDDAIFPDPSIEEVWYNDVDENCDGNLYDKDLDGHDSALYGGDDCWDDYDAIPDGYDAINGRAQPTADQVYPTADDAPYDGVDADCAGDTDFDADGDGFQATTPADRDGNTGVDCDDDDLGTYPGADDTWYDGIDSDCEGNSDYDADGDGYDSDSQISTGTDCDDVLASVSPAENESCSTDYDDNCDGALDLEDADGCSPFYLDADGDTYGTTTSQCWCEAQTGTNYDATVSTDCDDADSGDHPGATETVGNSDDENCDGGETCYDDDDDDGYLDTTADTRTSSDTDCADAYEGKNTDPTTDCDDRDAGDNPGETETVGNGDDEDCDGHETCYDDDDDDGYLDTTGDTRVSTDTDCADTYEGTDTDVTTDCDDADAGDHPGATETVGNSDDEDCDGTEVCYFDADDDGYVDAAAPTVASTDRDCIDAYEAQASALLLDPDCDDDAAGTYPGATETVGDEVDEDCDGGELCYDDDDDDGYLDATGDTRVSADADCDDANESDRLALTTDCNDSLATRSPGNTEVCDAANLDEDCDNVADDADSSTAAAGKTRYYPDDDGDEDGDESDAGTLYCDDPSTGSVEWSTSHTDCDDGNALAYEGATEIVGDGIDESCDGTETCYDDDDDDGYLDTTADTRASTDTDCTDAHEGTSSDLTTDCDDSSASAYPGATEVVGDGIDESCNGSEICYDDDDNDGYLDTAGDTRTSTDSDCTDAYEGTSSDLTTDCDDANSSAYPGATETIGDGVDESCDGTERCYDDDDNDGYLDTTGDYRTSTDTDCADAYEGTSSDLTTDCNDASASVYPTATEIVGDGVDENCDSSETCYDDDDDDGYLDTAGDTRTSSDSDCTDSYEGTSSDLTTDCDDTLSAVHPGGTEVCDSLDDDEDCDNLADDADPSATGKTTVYVDVDGDDYGTTTSTSYCDIPTAGYATASGDCDDTNASINPDGTEVCDALDADEDCDGLADDADSSVTGQTTVYVDADDDGYGTTTSADYCDVPSSGYATADGDCDDALATTNPGETDPTDGTLVDDDCDGFVDDDGIAGGTILFSEYFVADDPAYEYFEVYNNSAYEVSLEGWTFSICYDADSTESAGYVCDSTDNVGESVDTFTIGDVTVGPGEYAVLCNDEASFDTVACALDYTPVSTTGGLNPDAGGVALEMGSLLVDEIDWYTSGTSNTWPTDVAYAVQFSPSLFSIDETVNDDWSSDGVTDDQWCLSGSTTDWTSDLSGFYGTPGDANEECGE